MAGEGATRGRGRGSRGRGRGARGGRGGRGASSAASAPDPAANAPAENANPPAAEDTSMPDAPAAPPILAPTPAPQQSTEASGPAASSSAPARGARAGGRFLPRVVRRSQLDRDSIAAQETAKQESKSSADARLQRAARGGRGGGRRARGGPANFDRVIHGGGGGFGSAIQSSGTAAAAGGGPGAFSRLYDIPSVGGGSSGGPSGSSRNGVKSENGKPSFNLAQRPTGRRLNTDKIAEFIPVDNSDDQKTKNGTPNLLPKGLFRQEPDMPQENEDAKSDDPMVVSSGDSENGDVFYNDNSANIKDDGRRWAGAKEDQPVKIEGEEVTMVDAFTERRAKGKQAAKEEERKKQHKKKLKHKFEDEEERYHAEKMAKQRLLFGVASDEDSDDEFKEDKAQRKPQIAEGSIYLFQFPPVMPPLHKVDKPNAQKKQPVKDEPEDDDVVMLNAPEHDPSKPVDLTDAVDVKDEEEEGAARPGNKNKQPEPEEEPEGFVGKLVIRKSGKMQIDWGGMLFDCEMAIPRSFYREAVITEEDDTKQPDGFHGTAYGMGRVMGQFNSAPQWSEEQPWIVDPKDLPPWGSGAAPEGTEMEE